MPEILRLPAGGCSPGCDERYLVYRNKKVVKG